MDIETSWHPNLGADEAFEQSVLAVVVIDATVPRAYLLLRETHRGNDPITSALTEVAKAKVESFETDGPGGDQWMPDQVRSGAWRLRIREAEGITPIQFFPVGGLN